MKTLTYKILLRPEPEGAYTVIVPSLIGCVTWGETVPLAIANAKEAIQVYIDALKERGEEIPPSDDDLLECNLTLECA